MPILQKGTFSLFIVCILYLFQKHIGHENHLRWVHFRVHCLSYTSRLTGHSTPPLPRSKCETEGSHSQPALCLNFSSSRQHFTTTLPLSLETRDAGSSEHEKTPVLVYFHDQHLSNLQTIDACPCSAPSRFLSGGERSTTTLPLSLETRRFSKLPMTDAHRTRKDTSTVVSFRAQRLSNIHLHMQSTFPTSLMHAIHENTPTGMCSRVRRLQYTGVFPCSAPLYIISKYLI